MKTKIVIIGIILLFTIGIVAATNIDDFKVPDGYNNLNDGVASYTTNMDRMIYVEKVTGDYKTDWFTNTSDMTVINVGDNIYSYEDTVLDTYGYQEIVEIDGDTYMVSFDQDSKLSPSEQNSFLDDMKEFNKLNNLEPMEI